MAKAKPEPDYPYIDVEVPITNSNGKPDTEIRSKPDFMQDPKNQAEINSWDDNNDKARGNIMLRLHSVVAQKYYASEVTLTIWEGITAEYGKPGITAIFQEFTGAMNTSIPRNSDPSLAIEKICSHFMRMATSSCTLPEHLKVMILISKMPPSMTALIQLICQTDDVEKLDVDKIKRMIIMNWEQRLSTRHNNPSYQPQAAKEISAIQCSGPPPSFQQQQQQPQQEEQGQNQGQSQGSQRGGWRGGRGGCGGAYRETRAGKNKQNQQQQAARPIKERAPSPAPSFIFGKIASPLIVNPATIAVPADIPCSVYPNFTNALSLAHHLGVKPTTETVKTLEISERAREEQRLNQPNKHPRVKHDDEVSLGWSSDDDNKMFLANSAGPSSRHVKLASPLDTTNLFSSGYNTTHAMIEITSVVPYIENIICCPNVISNFTAEDHMNRVDWILDSGASLHFTGDIVLLTPVGCSEVV